MPLFGKDPCDRVDQTINQVLNGQVQAPIRLKKILKCIQNILREGDQSHRIKRELGGKLGLGYYRRHTTERKRQRHLVRAILLAELATGIKDEASSQHKTYLKGRTFQDLTTYAQNLAWNDRAKPTAIRTVNVKTEEAGYGPGNIIHKFSWGSTKANMYSLTYIPTREMVRYTRLRVGTAWYDIPMFGKERWDLVDVLAANPWHPVPMMSPDNPSCPGDVWNGPLGEGTDKHTQAQIGPVVGAFLKDVDELMDSEYWAVQEYQYNDTGDPDTWIRDYHKGPGAPPPPNYTVTDVHANDHHWTTFPRGKWVMKRKVYKKPDGQWYFMFTKEGFEDSNRTERYTTEVRVIDISRRPIVVKKEET